MKNSDSETKKDFADEDLLTRGWTRSLIESFLEHEDYRNPVDHFRNYSGKKMYQRRRVELIEASAEFEAAFMLSAKRRRLAPERIDATRTRIRELRETRDQLREANMRVLSQQEIVLRKIAELFEQARARGSRTPHK